MVAHGRATLVGHSCLDVGEQASRDGWHEGGTSARTTGTERDGKMGVRLLMEPTKGGHSSMRCLLIGWTCLSASGPTDPSRFQPFRRQCFHIVQTCKIDSLQARACKRASPSLKSTKPARRQPSTLRDIQIWPKSRVENRLALDGPRPCRRKRRAGSRLAA